MFDHDRICHEERGGRRLPHLGRRIVKTTVAVFLCLLIYSLRGYQGQDMPTESAITAIICMQPYVRDSRDYAVNRFAGSLVGAAWGLLLLLLLWRLPALGEGKLLLYALMALGVLACLYSTVLIHMPDASSLAAIVFLCVVIAFPDIEDPLRQALVRFVDVLIGTVVAIAVNVFHLPREKHRERVFFVRTRDLAPDRFSQIHPAVLYRLNYLHNDGAKICLMSEHAPAFFTLQMSRTRLSLPLIVMDGAAIYDADENRYLQLETIPLASSAALQDRLAELSVSYFIYTVHKNRTCIFHRGETRPEEQRIYDRMKSSPYRRYLEGEICDPGEIVYYKIIAEDALAVEIEKALRGVLPKTLRIVTRPQAGAPGLSGVYIYSAEATMAKAEARILAYLRREDPNLTPVEIRLRGDYRSERDAIHVLQMIGNAYEPVRLPGRRRK